MSQSRPRTPIIITRTEPERWNATPKHKVATILLAIVGVGFLFGALVDLTWATRGFPGVVITLLGKTSAQSDPKVAELVFILLRVSGVFYLTLGSAMLALTAGPFRERRPWARRVIAALVFPFLLAPFVSGALGFTSPTFIVPVFSVAFTALALWLTRDWARSD